MCAPDSVETTDKPNVLTEEENHDHPDDDDSDGNVRDYRKRLKRQRDRDRAAVAAAAGAGDERALVPHDEAGWDTDVEFRSDGTYRNKQRVLLFSSRGITSRFRHLLADLRKLIPHHKKVRHGKLAVFVPCTCRSKDHGM